MPGVARPAHDASRSAHPDGTASGRGKRDNGQRTHQHARHGKVTHPASAAVMRLRGSASCTTLKTAAIARRAGARSLFVSRQVASRRLTDAACAFQTVVGAGPARTLRHRDRHRGVRGAGRDAGCPDPRIRGLCAGRGRPAAGDRARQPSRRAGPLAAAAAGPAGRGGGHADAAQPGRHGAGPAVLHRGVAAGPRGAADRRGGTPARSAERRVVADRVGRAQRAAVDLAAAAAAGRALAVLWWIGAWALVWGAALVGAALRIRRWARSGSARAFA